MLADKTKLRAIEFTAIEPREWHGRYGRIPGNASVFHLGYSDSHRGLWPYVLMTHKEDLGKCWAVKSAGTLDLVAAVQAGKRYFGYGESGGYLINEYGQVLVPASNGDGRCAYVGIFGGKLQFQSPFKRGTVLDLSDHQGLTCDVVWDRPYVGCKYNWSFQHGIHFRDESQGGRSITVCPKQDDKLISALRRIRAEGYIRFIVNPHGLVLTKHLVGHEWLPVYVGRIDYTKWFAREE